MNPGDLVECINDAHYFPNFAPHLPVRGCIYTVRDVCASTRESPGVSLLLEEIVNPKCQYRDGLYEGSFYTWRFRPVRKPSIKVLRDLLEPVPA